MNKSEIIERVGRKLPELTEHDVRLSANELINTIIQSVTQKKRVELRGFGTFNIHFHPERNAHNPLTRESIIVKAKNALRFRPGKLLRARVNKSRQS